MSFRCIVVYIGTSSVFKEAVVLLFVIELMRFHIFMMDSIFNILIMVLEDIFLFCMSWDDVRWSKCCLRILDTFGIVFFSYFCAA